MAALLIYGLCQAVPEKRVALMLKRAEATLKRGRYVEAGKRYQTVLESVPNSTVAHLGLTCALFHSGDRSAATIELTAALKVGAFAGRLGDCGHDLDLNHVFFVAKLGLTDAFAVPKVAGARNIERALTDEPANTTAEEPDRMLLGACLARRAGLAGAAWDYAGNALEMGKVDGPGAGRFLACFGDRERRRAGCAHDPGVRKCLMTAAARRAYFRDVDLIDGRRSLGS